MCTPLRPGVVKTERKDEQRIDRKASVSVRGETVLFISRRKPLEGNRPTSGHVSLLRWTNEIRDTEERDESRDRSSRRSRRSVGTRQSHGIIQMEFTSRASCFELDQNWGSGSYERHFLCVVWLFLRLHSSRFHPPSLVVLYRVDLSLKGNQGFYPFTGRLFYPKLEDVRKVS